MNFIHQHIIAFILLLWVTPSVIAQSTPCGILLTQQKEFEAGTIINLAFRTSGVTQLYCHSSYGNVMLNPNLELGNSFYTLPDFLSKKKGIIDYNLIIKGKILCSGSIHIISATKHTILESYVGPPSISAGGHDFTMMVVIPTDEYDNPLADGIAATIKHQFLESIYVDEVVTKDFIFWKNIFSKETSGRFLISGEINNVSSKEYSIEIFPAQPTDFTIDYFRKHEYADGNQITTFSTSVIKDTYGNIASDGTLVDLVIKNKKGNILNAQGSTIKGIATIEVLHPDDEEIWTVSAYVSGMATSNTITLEYASITNEIPVQLSEQNRKISVGPLKSFMNQIIPDGAIVRLHISQQGNIIETKISTSRNGIVEFLLPEGFYKSGKYSFTIEALGIKKSFNDVEL